MSASKDEQIAMSTKMTLLDLDRALVRRWTGDSDINVKTFLSLPLTLLNHGYHHQEHGDKFTNGITARYRQSDWLADIQLKEAIKSRCVTSHPLARSGR